MERLGWVVALGLLSSACFVAPASEVVGADGGTVRGPDGEVLFVPAGALTTPVALTLERTSAGAPPLHVQGAGPILAALPHGQRFAELVTLTLPAPNGGVVVTAEPGGAWKALPTRRQAGTALVIVDHLSYFAVVPQFGQVVFGVANRVQAMGENGADVRTLFEGPVNQTSIAGVTARPDTGEVFFSDNGTDTVRALAPDGGLRTLQTSADPFLNPMGLAVDGANGLLFWTEGGVLKRAPLSGGAATIIAPSGVSDVEVEPAAQLLYWTDQESELVRRAAYDGSGAVTLHTQADRFANPRGIAVDAAAGLLFWIEGRDLKRSDLAGGQVRVLATGPDRSPWGVAVDPVRQQVFWTDNGTDSVSVANYDGTAARVLFTDPVATSNPSGIAVLP